MNDLSTRKCHNHRYREAAALCPECKNFFCRECITEHDDRVLCTRCLEKTAKKGTGSSNRMESVFLAARFFSGLIILWFAFYGLGQILLSIPSAFHEGTIWSMWMGG